LKEIYNHTNMIAAKEVEKGKGSFCLNWEDILKKVMSDTRGPLVKQWRCKDLLTYFPYFKKALFKYMCPDKKRTNFIKVIRLFNFILHLLHLTKNSSTARYYTTFPYIYVQVTYLIEYVSPNRYS
jgi:hypothetical protein